MRLKKRHHPPDCRHLRGRDARPRERRVENEGLGIEVPLQGAGRLSLGNADLWDSGSREGRFSAGI